VLKSIPNDHLNRKKMRLPTGFYTQHFHHVENWPHPVRVQLQVRRRRLAASHGTAARHSPRLSAAAAAAPPAAAAAPQPLGCPPAHLEPTTLACSSTASSTTA
jgi:hypothetical protein